MVNVLFTMFLLLSPSQPLCWSSLVHFFDSNKNCAYAVNSARPAGRLAYRPSVRRGKNFNVTIFSDTTSVVNVKLCTMVLLIELYPFIPLSVTLIVFEGHSSVKRCGLKISCSYTIKKKLFRIVKWVK